MSTGPARYWIGTLFDWQPPTVLPQGVCYLRGQQERCPTTDRLHHHVISGFTRPHRLCAVRRLVGNGHWEHTRSDAADAYVWKDDTAVDGTRFELGSKPIRRNSETDWEKVRSLAKAGTLEEVPADIFVRYYRVFSTLNIDTQVNC